MRRGRIGVGIPRALMLGSQARAFVLLALAAVGCSSRAHSNDSASQSEGETVPIPDCQDYARALRSCFEQTGVPAANALAAADLSARAPASLDAASRDARAAGCARERALLARTCR